MKIRLSVIIFSVLLLFASFNSAHSQEEVVNSRTLINNAKAYDGKIIIYKGEAIGDLMRRGRFSWVNAWDGENAIGIWSPLSLVGAINYTGGYKSKGDIIEVSGIFNRACQQHNGDMDIHAHSLRIIEQGRVITQEIDSVKKKQALIFLGVLLLSWISMLLIRK